MTHNDLLLGQIAVRKGFVTLEQLMQALQEQARDTPPGDVTVRIRRYQRPLGVILVAKGFLTDAQLLSLLQEQKTRMQMPADYLDLPREQVLFGQIVIREGLATPAQVGKSLRIQALQGSDPDSAGHENGNGAGRTLRLGEVMVRRGYLQPAQVLAVLRKQTKALLQCVECQTRYNVLGYEDQRRYKCRRCGAMLEMVTDMSSLSAEESGFLPPVSAPVPPSGLGDTRWLTKRPPIHPDAGPDE